MIDFMVAIGLVLVIEGLLWAVAPHLALRMLAAASQMPEGQLKLSGWVAVVIGVFIVWAIRG